MQNASILKIGWAFCCTLRRHLSWNLPRLYGIAYQLVASFFVWPDVQIFLIIFSYEVSMIFFPKDLLRSLIFYWWRAFYSMIIIVSLFFGKSASASFSVFNWKFSLLIKNLCLENMLKKSPRPLLFGAQDVIDQNFSGCEQNINNLMPWRKLHGTIDLWCNIFLQQNFCTPAKSLNIDLHEKVYWKSLQEDAISVYYFLYFT